jgi:thiol-disulfide isomerase/thioredoxin
LNNKHASGHATRRALLVAAGLSAAGLGAWWSLRRLETTQADKDAASHDGPYPSGTAQPSAATASAPLIQSDQLTAAFWAQQFDTPTGTRLNLARFQGKPLLINFWATWCPPCVKELPELNRFHKDFAPKGWQVIGLAIDGPTPVKEFLAKVGVGFDLGLAGFGGTELSQALGNEAGGLPFSVVIDAQGRVRHRKMGATSYEELAQWAKEISAG